MRLKLAILGLSTLILIITGCTNIENLTPEEILERTVNNMENLQSYSFDLKSEHMDGGGNETLLQLKGDTIVAPFEANIEKHLEFFGNSFDLNVYHMEETVYYEDFTAPDLLFKAENNQEPDHFIKGLKGLQARFERLQFTDDEDKQYYQFDYAVEQEEDKEFFTDLYPFFLSADPLETILNNFYLDHSDVVDFHVTIDVDKDSHLISGFTMQYVFDYDFLETGEPIPSSEKIEVVLHHHNELDDVAIPADEIESAVTFREHIEIINEEREARRKAHVPEVIEEDLGNSGGNLQNGGRLATDGEWLYFSNFNEGFYRKKIHGFERQQLSENEAAEINIVGDWIFYIDVTRGNQAYRMKKDGSERRQITDVYTENIMVVDDWLYYKPLVYSPDGKTRVYWVKTDLTHLEQLLENAFQFTVAQGYLLYQNDYPGTIHYLDLDDIDAGPVMLGGTNAKNFFVADGWLYFENADEDDRIFRQSLDNLQTDALTEEASQGLNVAGDDVFYRNIDDDRSLYRYNIDTEETTKLDDGEVYNIHIVGDYVYYGKAATRVRVQWYRIPIDGTEVEEVEL
ncbi:hypothetical protein J2S74_000060 [Evansella vedderi]|uniref:Prolow-density lipoprotein receptor-related protein 1-like beta-propeller domain-containing protein n=1 Tax=Evansella vedderi TaxID=38282 RepID=A0ABT9ZN75_9BACI|nr:DUF6612 family protein [Evansella vedderi]MDQ0252688.1 hypothetical protein [Evansella vedderi]